jgi:hydroxymethylbilane synthase
MSLSKIRIAARHSDLARLQAYRVGDAIRAAYPSLEIEYAFRASLGDQNLEDPLWKMPEKGVFTEDFVRDLHEGTADLVVHSWKDLPTELRPGLSIACTLPRADQRDLFLFKKSALADVRADGKLKVLTSSPRRAFNLDAFFRGYLPFPIKDVVFENVRGNIPTRMRKLLDGSADALIVAKAAVDRLLESNEAEFQDARDVVSKCLVETRQMVLPLSLNPTAAAQGALAVEIRSDRTDLSKILAVIHSPSTFAAVVREREILSSYGGGCHQKIGISILDRVYGRITYLQGLTDSGERLDARALDTFEAMPKCQGEDQLFPRLGEESPFFDRTFLPRGIWSSAEQAKHLFVARDTAWPDGFRPLDEAVICTAGLKTWKKLASKGVWVTGSTESLGEAEVASLAMPTGNVLESTPPQWTKLTHERAAAQNPVIAGVMAVATYTLTPSSRPPDLRNRTHFFWMSGTAFDRAVELYPEIAAVGVHASGPGHTHDHLKKSLPRTSTPLVYLNAEQFRRAALS